MSDINEMNEMSLDGPRMDKVLITGIIVAGIVLLSCILAFTIITIMFVNNAPW
jgi:hypothetical protein